MALDNSKDSQICCSMNESLKAYLLGALGLEIEVNLLKLPKFLSLRSCYDP